MWGSADSPRRMNSVMVLWFPKTMIEDVSLEWKHKEAWNIHLLFVPPQDFYFILRMHISLSSVCSSFTWILKKFTLPPSLPRILPSLDCQLHSSWTLNQPICALFPRGSSPTNSSGDLYIIFQFSLWLTGFISLNCPLILSYNTTSQMISNSLLGEVTLNHLWFFELHSLSPSIQKLAIVQYYLIITCYIYYNSSCHVSLSSIFGSLILKCMYVWVCMWWGMGLRKDIANLYF